MQSRTAGKETCLWFELDKLIKVRIEIDYGAVRYEEKEYSPSKEGPLW